MSNDEINDVRNSHDQEDFEHIWLRIGADIKIRNFENLDDIPEFHQLPNQLQNDIKNEMITMDNDYKVFHSEQYFDNFHAILFIKRKDKEKYLAIYQDKKPSINMRALLSSIGVGGIYFIWNAFISFSNTQTLNSDDQQPLVTNNNPIDVTEANNIASSSWANLFPRISSIIPPAFAYPLFRKWFSTRDSIYNKLIEACMLKKLESISNSS